LIVLIANAHPGDNPKGLSPTPTPERIAAQRTHAPIPCRNRRATCAMNATGTKRPASRDLSEGAVKQPIICKGLSVPSDKPPPLP
jgi:hypothetical protein